MINTNHYNAGVLLCSYYKNEIHFLLGKDKKYNKWSDFGGKCESIDNDRWLNTATRELYEETSGIIYSIYEIRYKLKNCNILYCKSYNNHAYYMYLLFIPFKDYFSVFNDQYKFIRDIKSISYKFKEKRQIKWFTLNDILNNKNQMRHVFYKSFYNNLNEIKDCVTLYKNKL